MNSEDRVRVVSTGGALGAEIEGVDLSDPLDADLVALIRQALLNHLVVFFRDQDLTEEDQIRFTNYFGRAVEHVRRQPNRSNPEIFIISNIEENGRQVGALGNHELEFHSDLSYVQKPGTICTLYALEVPETGGATQWCNCYAAYSALDEETKAGLRGKRAVHRHYVEAQNPPEPVDHPVVRKHPETRRKCLYVGPHLTQHVVGLPHLESDALLKKLYDHAGRSEFVWTHQWRAHDLVMWDNRPTMHRREPFPSDQRRLMKRTQVFNGDDVPFE